MKITMHIEVTSAEELNRVSDALGAIMSAEVSHPISTPSIQGEVMKEEKKPRSRGKKVEEKEEMIPVDSPFAHTANAADVMAPIEPLVNNATVQQAPVHHIHQAPVNQFSPGDFIKAEAQRLEAASHVPKDAKRNLIEALKVEIQAPQGFAASQLPEPYVSAFAGLFPRKIDALIAQYSGATTAALV